MAEVRLRKGKGDFVRRQTPDGVENVCLCIYNADASEGCPSQVPPDLYDEVINNDGKYSVETKKKWLKEKGHLPDLRCDYCYDKRKNGGNIRPKDVGEKTRADFEKYSPEYVRVNKSTEFGHPLYRKNLLDFLDLCNEFNAKVIFPTKMLQFDESVAKKLIENGGVLSYSLGNNRMERGCCANGFHNLWRKKEAEKYFDYGVNVLMTMALDITDSIENNEKRGFFITPVLESKVDVKRIVPMRLTSAEVALKITGIERQDLINPLEAVGHFNGWEKYTKEVQQRILSRPYVQRNNNSLVANLIHPDFKWFEENLRICGQVGKYEYCDKCNLSSEKLKFPTSELVEVNYEKKDENGKNKLQNSRRKINKMRKGLIKNQGNNKKNSVHELKLF